MRKVRLLLLLVSLSWRASTMGHAKFPFYTDMLKRYFVRPGDTVLNPTSDYLLLAAYVTKCMMYE